MGENLQPQDNIKLLGITINKVLNCNAHVGKIAKCAGQQLGIIWKAKALLDASGLATYSLQD